MALTLVLPAPGRVEAAQLLQYPAFHGVESSHAALRPSRGAPNNSFVSAAAAVPPACSDGIDDDEDGLSDYPDDPGCTSPDDTSEVNPASTACSDGLDNDEDGLSDYPDDPGCTSPDDTSEVNACSDGVDNDADGKEDYPDDPGCTSPDDASEIDPPLALCRDKIDNDEDGKTDYPDDPGCTSPDDTSEVNPASTACSDGRDNDRDGKEDFPDDPGCISPHDGSEIDHPLAQCRDKIDNDEDGKTDFPLDRGCTSREDSSETNQLRPALRLQPDGKASPGQRLTVIGTGFPSGARGDIIFDYDRLAPKDVGDYVVKKGKHHFRTFMIVPDRPADTYSVAAVGLRSGGGPPLIVGVTLVVATASVTASSNSSIWIVVVLTVLGLVMAVGWRGLHFRRSRSWTHRVRAQAHSVPVSDFDVHTMEPRSPPPVRTRVMVHRRPWIPASKEQRR